MTPAVDVDAALLALAALGLDGDSALPSAVLDEPTATALLDGAKAQKLVGLLDQAIAAEALHLSPEAASAVAQRAEQVMAWCLLVERHAIGVHHLLDAAGIAHRFVKGLTSAHRFHTHPALRTFVDVDVLMRGPDLDRAAEVLLAADHRRAQREWKAGFAARWGKSITLRSGAGVEVDLHRVLASGPYGLRSDGTPLWKRPGAAVAVGGVELPCLDPSAAFVHACVHVVTGTRAHLSSLRDVAVTLAHADDRSVADLEEALGVAPCVTEAVDLTWRRLRLDPDRHAELLRHRPIGRRDRRWLDLYATPGRSFRRLAIAGVGAVPTMGGKVAYTLALARPR